MEKVKLENITFDKEDTALFDLKDDLLLKAKAIKYSILPKLNILLEEALARIRKIYGIEVFNQHSIIHSAPAFREQRETELKIDYNYAFLGLGGSRKPVWTGFKREDNKPVKIIPYIIGFGFTNYGLTLVFDPLRYPLKYAKESHEIFYNFLLENLEYVQTIQSFAKISPNFLLFEKENMIKPFKEIVEKHKEKVVESNKKKCYCLDFTRTIKSPLNYSELNSLIDSFVLFFPVYYSMLEIAQDKPCSFKEIISKVNYKNLIENYPNTNKESPSNVIDSVNTEIDKTKFVKAGIRWQVFDRDDFRCVACGKSAHDGAILHVDHIVPKSKGGRNIIDNYQTLCHLCNIGKSNKSEKN